MSFLQLVGAQQTYQGQGTSDARVPQKRPEVELLEDGRAREGHARRGCECYVGRRHCYIGRRHRCDGVGASAPRCRQVCVPS